MGAFDSIMAGRHRDGSIATITLDVDTAGSGLVLVRHSGLDFREIPFSVVVVVGSGGGAFHPSVRTSAAPLGGKLAALFLVLLVDNSFLLEESSMF